MIKALQDLSTVSTGWTSALYCGLIIHWNYLQQHVDISMPSYVAATLHKFQHATPTQPEDASCYAWNVPTKGAKIQYVAKLDASNPLPKPPAFSRFWASS